MKTSDHSTIRALQTNLRKLFFPVRVNGLYDAHTQVAVRVMQAAHSMQPTGEIDEATIAALEAGVAHLPIWRAASEWGAHGCSVSLPRAYEPVRGLYAADEIRGAVALTFDDGPSPRYTRMVLRILNEAGVSATFYVKGALASRHADLIREMARDHRVGNHSWNHPVLTDATNRQISDEITSTAALIQGLLPGPARSTFRPPMGIPFHTRSAPFGALWQRFGQVIAAADHDLMMWHLCTYDWKYRGRPEAVVARLLAELARVPGGVILMHDVHLQTVLALPGILEVIRRRNIAIVSDAELLKRKYEQQSASARIAPEGISQTRM